MLSQTSEYALRAAVFLGEQYGTPRTAREIAEAIRVPGGYLSKVLQSLGRAGIVHSQRGLGGGFVLAKPPTDITVLDVIRVVEPFRRVIKCPLDLPEHRDQLCPLHQRLDDAVAMLERTFGSSTVADLLAEAQATGTARATSFPHAKNNGCGTGCCQTAKRNAPPQHNE